TCYITLLFSIPVPQIGTDCGDIKGTRSGVYKIKPQGVHEPFSVYCDMQTEGEGWTVFQRRQDGSVDFYRDWASYETGFGYLMGEFWLGLELCKSWNGVTTIVLLSLVQWYTVTCIILCVTHQHIRFYSRQMNCTSINQSINGFEQNMQYNTAIFSIPVPRIGTDCGDISGTRSGVYKIKPKGVDEPFSVYCDMQTDGKGWTVFQRRQDGTVDFYRDWASYETGFGDLMGEFWLGNNFIHGITNQGSYELMVNMSDFEGHSAYAHYNIFDVGDADSKYLLTVSGFSGTAGDGMIHQNNMKFSTYDRDHDTYDSNCAAVFRGAWWYNKCHYSNLNGVYYGGPHTSYADGVNWSHWKGQYYSLKSTTMSVRRLH
ncbi:hypothetical protein ScPMuIL_010248, partial [Solemya velum]